MNKVYVYYERLMLSDEAETIELFLKSWRFYGWNPVILHQDEAMRHPKAAEFAERVSTYPTVNNRQYELACYMRWLAFQRHAPGVFSDYDIINFGFSPGDFTPEDPMVFLHGESWVVPIYANRDGIELAIKGIEEWDGKTETVFGQDHISDMYLAIKKTRGRFRSYDFTVDYKKPGYETKSLVHFMGPACGRNKSQFIEQERARRKQKW